MVEIKQPLDVAHLRTIQARSEKIDTLLHPSAVLVRQVLTRAGRLELDLILIDDEENILEALDAGIEIHSVYYTGGEMLSEGLIQRLPEKVGMYEIAKRTCKKLFENDKLSRVFAIAHMPVSHTLESLLKTPRDIVALEGVTISGNIGAIVRTSLAFGAGGIVLLNADAGDIYDRRLIRASRGHIFSLPVVTTSAAELIDFCKQNKLPIVVMAARSDNQIQKVTPLSRRLVIIVGSEKDGCSQTLMDAATLQIQIPTEAKVESLNVATAAAIMLYSRSWFNIPPGRKQCTL